MREITDKLEQGIKELFESEKYKEYLRTMSKFYNYSFNNTLLRSRTQRLLPDTPHGSATSTGMS